MNAGGMQLVVLLILLSLIVFMVWRTVKYFIKKAKQGKLKESLTRTSIVLLVVILVLTLPFHYVPSEGKAFPKSNFTFKNTFITSDDVQEITERYNNANFMEKMQMRSDPFFETLMGEGIIFEEDRFENEY